MTKPTLIALLPLLFACGLLAQQGNKARTLRDGFVDLQEYMPDLKVDLRYHNRKNFIGKRIAGYEADRCVGTKPLALALTKVQTALKPYKLGLKVFDAYRPQRAVAQFVRWANDANDVTHKATYYPKVAKRDLIEEGYIASKSSHSRGSSIDLTLIDLSDPKHPELDMGSSFDLFDPQSHAENLEVSATQSRDWGADLWDRYTVMLPSDPMCTTELSTSS